jgi:hypothetical protein
MLYAYFAWFIFSMVPLLCGASLDGIDLAVTFEGSLKNGSTYYLEDRVHTWSVRVYPPSANVFVTKDGFSITQWNENGQYEERGSGFHVVEAVAVYQGSVSRSRLYYTLISKARGVTEWGLQPFTPLGFVPTGKDLLADWTGNGLRVKLFSPKCQPRGVYHLPLVGRATVGDVHLQAVNVIVDVFQEDGAGKVTKRGELRLTRGLGSLLLEGLEDSPKKSDDGDKFFQLNFRVNNMGSGSLTIPVCNMDQQEHLPPTISKQTASFPVSSILQVGSKGLSIQDRGSLELCGDSYLLMASAAMIRLSRGGSMTIRPCSGSMPVVILAAKREAPWAGIYVEGKGSELLLQFAMLVLSGASLPGHRGSGLGHRDETAVIHAQKNALVRMKSVYLFDGKGQAIVAKDSRVDVTDSLVQRFTCGLQILDVNASIESSVFHGFPGIPGKEHEDSDHDAMYIVGGNVSIIKSAVGDAMDDCIDSGTGPGGSLLIKESWVESCFHEGVALSDNGWGISKNVRIERSVIRDNQQGIELGFSTHFHTVDVRSSLIIENQIGLRIGDNYGWATEGILRCDGCIFANNSEGIKNLHAGNFRSMPEQIVMAGSVIQPGDVLERHYQPDNIRLNVNAILQSPMSGWIRPVVTSAYTPDGTERLGDLCAQRSNICGPILGSETLRDVSSASECADTDVITLTMGERDQSNDITMSSCAFHLDGESHSAAVARFRWESTRFCQKHRVLSENDRNTIQTALLNHRRGQLSPSKKSAPRPENHILILWGTVPNNVRDDIRTFLCQNASGMVVASAWDIYPSKDMASKFDENWYKRFYGDKYYHIYEAGNPITMHQHKGGSVFSAFLLHDRTPSYFDAKHGKGYVNKRVYNLKYGLRSWLPKRFSLHTSQTSAESDRDIHWLWGSMPSKEDGCNAVQRGIYVNKFKRVASAVSISQVMRNIARGEFFGYSLDVKEIEYDIRMSLSAPGHTATPMSDMYAGAILGTSRMPIVAQTPDDTKWYKTTVTLAEIAGMYVLNSKSWWGIDRPCTKISSVAERMFRENSKGSRSKNRHVTKLMSMLEVKATPERTVTAVTHDFTHFTLYDGNHRSMYLHLTENKAVEIDLVIGYSPLFGRAYKGNFYCLGEHQPAYDGRGG